MGLTGSWPRPEIPKDKASEKQHQPLLLPLSLPLHLPPSFVPRTKVLNDNTCVALRSPQTTFGPNPRSARRSLIMCKERIFYMLDPATTSYMLHDLESNSWAPHTQLVPA